MKYKYAYLETSDGVYWVVKPSFGFHCLSDLDNLRALLLATNWKWDKPNEYVDLWKPTVWVREYTFYKTFRELVSDRIIDLI